MATNRIKIFDTTLRDGEQAPGCSMTLREKLRIAKALADLNVDISTEKFRNGSINSFNFRTVQNNQLIAGIQELQSMYDLIDSRVTLMRLTGGIIEVYK